MGDEVWVGHPKQSWVKASRLSCGAGGWTAKEDMHLRLPLQFVVGGGGISSSLLSCFISCHRGPCVVVSI